MEIFLFWLIFSFVVGFIGSSRKIGFAGAFFASLLLSPLIGLIITLVSKNKEEEEYKKKILKVQSEQKVTLEKLAKTKASNKVTISITDELQKLKDLKDSEVITHEEFKELKKRIINNSSEESKTEAKRNKNIASEEMKSKEAIAKRLKLLRSRLKDDELIVLVKGNKQPRIIPKVRFEIEKKIGMSEDYTILERE